MISPLHVMALLVNASQKGGPLHKDALAKGRNKLLGLPDSLIKARCRRCGAGGGAKVGGRDARRWRRRRFRRSG